METYQKNYFITWSYYQMSVILGAMHQAANEVQLQSLKKQERETVKKS